MINRIALAAVVMYAVAATGSARAVATPEPSPAPVSWELSLDPTIPQRIVVDTGHGPQTYWYFLYTVTNNTGDDVAFHPEIVRTEEVATELPAEQATALPEHAPRITVTPSIVGLNAKIYDAIATRHAKTHPFLVRPVDAITRLKQGKDNALTSASVFPDMDVNVSRFTIYFGGLSGEQIIKPNPAYDPSRDKNASDEGSDDNPRVFVLRKTLKIPYTLPGDANTRRTAAPQLGRMDWVMR
jgi:hypothetical protein